MTAPFKSPAGAVQTALAAAEAQAKEVMERLPLKDATKEVLQQAQADVDAQLLAAVERYLGGPVTDPAQVEGRLRHADVVDGKRGRTFYMDGMPLLRIGPLQVYREGDIIHGKHDVVHFEAKAGEQ
jgi:hypothetical protein